MWTEDAMKEFHFHARVYFSDTDAEGIIYHTKYLDFAEHARTEMLREALPGLSQRDLQKDGVIFVVRNISIDYRMPGFLDDELDVSTAAEASGHFSAVFHQEIRRGDDLLCTVTVKAASVNTETKRPVPLPKEIMDALL